MTSRESILLKAKDELLQQALDDNRFLEAALQRIINPIKFMTEDAKRDGMLLNGQMAVQLSEDHNYLKQIAKEALARLTPSPGCTPSAPPRSSPDRP